MITTGVYVVFCAGEGGFVGMSMTWVSKIDLNHVMLSFPRKAYGTKCLLESGRFTLSALHEGQMDIGSHYGGKSARKRGAPEGEPLTTDRWDMPVSDGALGWSLNEVKDFADFNHQKLVYARILEEVPGSGKPLLYRDRDYFA